jgi:hypothetical protein
MHSICAHYLRGSCRFGDRCRNSHELNNPTRNRKYRIVVLMLFLHDIYRQWFYVVLYFFFCKYEYKFIFDRKL